MLFSEIYGSYFHAVSDILREASAGGLTGKRLTELVRETAFAESTLSIPAALKDGSWPLLDRDLKPVLRHAPSMPLATLQKRWLKALLLDRRIALFAPSAAGLEDVEPLYRPEVFVLFDQYADGDPYEDETYIKCFQMILQAIREKRVLRVRFHDHTGRPHAISCVPYRLEYSEKDDKFRLFATGKSRSHVINLSRIHACEILEAGVPGEFHPPKKRELELLLHDERNGLERVLLHFSHFEKETRKLNDRLYQIKLRYDGDDEAELLIRVMSFGPVLEVKSPERFTALVRERIRRQLQFPPPPAGTTPAPTPRPIPPP